MIGETFGVKPETVERWLRQARHDISPAHADERYLEPGVYASDDRGREPDDPASPLALARSFAHTPEQLADLQRAGLLPLSLPPDLE
jgi:transposase-like protein